MNKELGYLVVAAGTSVLAVAPLELHDFPLDPRLVPWAAGFGVLWVGLRLGMFLRAWERWRRWRRSPRWSFNAADLPFEGLYRLLSADTVPGRPVGLRFWLTEGLCYRLRHPLSRPLLHWLAGRLYPDRGILLGRAFQWSPQHTQELETYVRDTASPLPTGADMRGGYPAPARRRHQEGTASGAAVERARRPRAYRRHDEKRQDTPARSHSLRGHSGAGHGHRH